MGKKRKKVEDNEVFDMIMTLLYEQVRPLSRFIEGQVGRVVYELFKRYEIRKKR